MVAFLRVACLVKEQAIRLAAVRLPCEQFTDANLLRTFLNQDPFACGIWITQLPCGPGIRPFSPTPRGSLCVLL